MCIEYWCIHYRLAACEGIDVYRHIVYIQCRDTRVKVVLYLTYITCGEISHSFMTTKPQASVLCLLHSSLRKFITLQTVSYGIVSKYAFVFVETRQTGIGGEPQLSIHILIDGKYRIR